MSFDYSLLNTKYTKNLWQKIGINRRAGLMCPLFSIYSDKSLGIGEFRDLIYVIDWCKKTGNTILQLLPLNEAGYGNSPYSATSSFALDPIYISVDEIIGAKIDVSDDITKLKNMFPTTRKHVNYQIKREKLVLLRKIFGTADLNILEYKKFKNENIYWLDDYSRFKIERSAETNEFFKWVQWQAYEQMKKVANYARENNIKIMGDIPFLVSRDSADVLGKYKDVFNLDEIAGCPPDAYNALGQKWGMPGYNWQALKQTNYQYFKDKLKYAENFFEMYRIDHVVGMFRLWTISKDEPEENAGLNGKFDPMDESTWEENGRNILKAMISSSQMMPCAEDLGVIPDVCTKVLDELGIVGMDVSRWLKDRTKEPRNFVKPENFRKVSVAVSSSHDMSNTASWVFYELDTTDEFCFKKSCKEKGINFDEVAPKLFDLKNSKFGRLRWKDDVENEDIFLWNIARPKHEVWDLLDSYRETFNEKKLLDLKDGNIKDIVCDLLKYTSSSASIFCIHSILDFMLMEFENKIEDIWGFRINFPGSVGEQNWSIRIPIKLEDFVNMQVNGKILIMNEQTGRV